MQTSRLLAPVVALLSTACYSYVHPDRTLDVPPGSAVLVELTDAGATAVEPAVGRQAVRVEGRVLDASSDSLVVALSRVSYRRTDPTSWVGETLTLRSEHMRWASQRTFSRRKTMIAVGSAALAAIGGFLWIRSAIDGSSPGSGRPPGGI